MSDISTAHTGKAGKLEIHRKPDVYGVVLTLIGELDLASAPEVARHLRECETMRSGRLLIDLAGVSFIDSTGLTLLIRAHESAQANGHGFTLRRGPNQVQRLFELTGVLERFTFED